MTGVGKLGCLIASCIVLLFPFAAAGQEYPTGTVRIVVPFSPGGSTDVLGRILAQKLSEELNGTFIVENRAGANTVTAANMVARSAPDGLTLFLTSSATFTMNKSLLPQISYDPVKDFAAVSLVAEQTLLFSVNAKSPLKSLKEMVDFSKANPGKLNLGIGAIVSRVAAELFKRVSGADYLIVTYPGAIPTLQALLGQNIELVVSDTGSFVPQIRSGQIRGLATTGKSRDVLAPEIPTVRESGYPTYDVPSWNGLFAPAGTPSTIIDRLNAAIVKAMSSPEVKEKVAGLGLAATATTAQHLENVVKTESEKWDKVIKEIGLQLN